MQESYTIDLEKKQNEEILLNLRCLKPAGGFIVLPFHPSAPPY